MKDHLIIFDTTLRDGEQSPGASMTKEEKLRVARQLERMQVDVIEAGFAAASPGDFDAIRSIARAIKGSTVCSLARSNENDIRRAGEAITPAARGRIHTFIATSPIHMEKKLRMAPDQVVEAAVRAVRWAREYTDDVEFSAEDAVRSDVDFLCRVFGAVIEAGAATINVPDTVGYSVPSVWGELIRTLIARVPGAGQVVWSTHCHNDLGLAVANSLAGVINGARQIECAINGMGERAGNAAPEECVMALKVRGDSLPFYTEVVTPKLSRASKMVSSITGFPVQYNKAIVGKNAFAHESGIHQDGMLKNRETYEIMKPEDVGVPSTSLIMGKLSGRNAFRDKLESLGYVLEAAALNDAFKRFKDLADKKKHVFDEDIIALVDEQMSGKQERITLKRLKVVAGTDGPQSAELELIVDGEPRSTNATGNGPVDAVFNGIRQLCPHTAVLELYQVSAVTEGTDAQATVSVRLAEQGLVATGKASDPDTLVASARAYIHALNKLDVRRAKATGAAA